MSIKESPSSPPGQMARAVQGVARHLVGICVAAAFVGDVHANPLAFVGYGDGSFGTIDLSTGAVNSLGSLGQTPAGLGVFHGSLYAESYNSNGTLYSVNTSNGALTAIGNSGVFYLGGFGSTLNGLYGVGYASGATTLDLFSIDASTGSATDIGSTGLGLGAWRDISTNSNTLYFGDGSNLYSLNLANGAASLVGAYGNGAQMGSLVTIGGTLYGADDVGNRIDTIDTSTGAATTGSSSGGTVWGLAPDPLATVSPVPEPGMLPLLGLGLAAVGYMRRHKRRNAN